jgi:hypothetical protein
VCRQVKMQQCAPIDDDNLVAAPLSAHVWVPTLELR